jgi:EAL domain-containing protein (putative c-di-GMP-specific phosphodiesterase class I)
MRFPVDRIKIDRSFIRDVTVDASSSAVTTAIIALAKGLNMAVLAEGVETAEQRDLLIARGCNSAQGYLFARPTSAQALASTIQTIERAEALVRNP